MNKVLARWNTLDPEAAAREALPCCGSSAWAAALASKRPIPDEASLIAASIASGSRSPRSAWREAFDSHPRIGQKARAVPRHRRIPALVRTGAARRSLRGRRRQTRTRRGQPPLRAEVRTHLHHLRLRQNVCRDSRHPRSSHEQRCRRRTSRSSRTATPDHAASPASLAGVKLTMGISTHILDTALGRPAAEVPVSLARMTDGAVAPHPRRHHRRRWPLQTSAPRSTALAARNLSHPLRHRCLLQAQQLARPLSLRRHRLRSHRPEPSTTTFPFC